jgi:hypothetical protein
MATPGSGIDDNWSATVAGKLPPPSLWDPLGKSTEDDHGSPDRTVGAKREERQEYHNRSSIVPMCFNNSMLVLRYFTVGAVRNSAMTIDN